MRTISMTVVAIALAFSSLAAAQPSCGLGGQGMHAQLPGGPGGPGGDGRGMGEPLALEGVMPLLERLDLNLEQWAEVETIIADAREEVAALLEDSERGEMMRAFLETFSSESVTASDFEAVADEMQERRDEVRAIGFTALVRIHDVLTDDQLGMIRSVLDRDLLPVGGMMRMHCR